MITGALGISCPGIRPKKLRLPDGYVSLYHVSLVQLELLIIAPSINSPEIRYIAKSADYIIDEPVVKIDGKSFNMVEDLPVIISHVVDTLHEGAAEEIRSLKATRRWHGYN